MPDLGQEIEVKIVDDKLMVTIPGAPPELEITLAPEGGRQFRMKGGPVDGELAIFELDEVGSVTGVKAGNYYFERG